jgi:hypothetical protein
MSHRDLIAAVVGGAIAVVLAGGVAWAAIPGPGEVIQGCYDSGGNLKVVPALPCPKGYTPLQWNQQGPPGPPGSQGVPGTPGTPGADGSDAASAFTGRVDGALIFGNVPPTEITRYAEPNGSSEHVHLLEENTRTHLSPNATIVASDLVVKALMSGSGDTATFTLRDDGIDTAVSCTITVNSPSSNIVQTCDSGAATATILSGSELSLEITVNGTTLVKPPILFAWRATTP